MRRALVAFAALLLAGACGREVSGPEPRPGDAVLELRAEELAPAAILWLGERHRRGLLGTHSWEQGPGVMAFADSGLIIPESYLRLTTGTRLVALTDAEDVSGTLMAPPLRSDQEPRIVRRLSLSDGTEILTARPGRYLLEVYGHWPQGQGWFIFGIELLDSSA